MFQKRNKSHSWTHTQTRYIPGQYDDRINIQIVQIATRDLHENYKNKTILAILVQIGKF